MSPIVRNYPGLTAEEGEGPLRVVRGRINSTPTAAILAGTGFTIVRDGTGLVTITFDEAFAGDPAAVIGVLVNGGINDVDIRVSTTSFQARIATAAGVLVDSTFNFLAIGPA